MNLKLFENYNEIVKADTNQKDKRPTEKLNYREVAFSPNWIREDKKGSKGIKKKIGFCLLEA